MRPTPTPPRDSSPARSSAESGGVPTWAWIAGGVGLASSIVAVVFFADQNNTQDDFDAECKVAGYDDARCDRLESRLNRDFGLWVGFGAAGLLGLGAATYGALQGSF
jgi:hypothetical protein